MSKEFETLELRGAEVSRNGQLLLGPLDLTIQSGGITMVLGHNGAGKSLFLQLCHGQFPANNGEVLWNNEPAEATRGSRSYMFQDTALMRRSVFSNIEFPLIVHGVSKEERLKRVNAVLTDARLSQHSNAPAASLSGGEKQRLALARALVIGPQVILLDEPSASLDPASTKELEFSVKKIAESGVKVLIATHDLMQARRLADDVLVFGEGKLLVQDNAVDFFNNPQSGVVADFLEGRL